MEKVLERQLAEFTNRHDQFINDWNKAMHTGDTSALECMADDYYVSFFSGASDKPMMFDRNESIAGMKQSVEQLLGAQKKFENRVIRLKNKGNAVVFYELLLEKDGNVLARLLTIENWQLTDNQWLLAREIVEQVN